MTDDATLLVGVGASAGGVEALSALMRELPADLPAAVLVVLHVAPTGTSVLARILDRAGPLPAMAAEDGIKPLRGHVYVAPPDRHLVLVDGVMRLSAGPKENGHRPSIDPTLRSLADLGSRAVGVILSGTRDDGTVGLAHLAAAGGTTLVQDPREAAYESMVRSAIAHVDVDAILPVAGIADRVVSLAGEESPTPSPAHEHRAGAADATSTRYTCPECGGHLSRARREGVVRFTCEVGHAYAPASLDGEQGMAVERALWAATRLLEDRAVLLDEMASRSRATGSERIADGFGRQAHEARRASTAVRSLLD